MSYQQKINTAYDKAIAELGKSIPAIQVIEDYNEATHAIICMARQNHPEIADGIIELISTKRNLLSRFEPPSML